jgi:hypothetical protein
VLCYDCMQRLNSPLCAIARMLYGIAHYLLDYVLYLPVGVMVQGAPTPGPLRHPNGGLFAEENKGITAIRRAVGIQNAHEGIQGTITSHVRIPRAAL